MGISTAKATSVWLHCQSDDCSEVHVKRVADKTAIVTGGGSGLGGGGRSGVGGGLSSVGGRGLGIV